MDRESGADFAAAALLLVFFSAKGDSVVVKDSGDVWCGKSDFTTVVFLIAVR